MWLIDRSMQSRPPFVPFRFNHSFPLGMIYCWRKDRWKRWDLGCDKSLGEKKYLFGLVLAEECRRKRRHLSWFDLLQSELGQKIKRVRLHFLFWSRDCKYAMAEHDILKDRLKFHCSLRNLMRAGREIRSPCLLALKMKWPFLFYPRRKAWAVCH